MTKEQLIEFIRKIDEMSQYPPTDAFDQGIDFALFAVKKDLEGFLYATPKDAN